MKEAWNLTLACSTSRRSGLPDFEKSETKRMKTLSHKNRDKCGAKLYWLRSPSEIIGDRFIDPKE